MVIITIVRVTTTLTFLILASGGPYAIWQLRAFIVRYTQAHAVLRARVEADKVAYVALEVRVEEVERRLEQLEGHAR